MASVDEGGPFVEDAVGLCSDNAWTGADKGDDSCSNEGSRMKESAQRRGGAEAKGSAEKREGAVTDGDHGAVSPEGLLVKCGGGKAGGIEGGKAGAREGGRVTGEGEGSEEASIDPRENAVVGQDPGGSRSGREGVSSVARDLHVGWLPRGIALALAPAMDALDCDVTGELG